MGMFDDILGIKGKDKKARVLGDTGYKSQHQRLKAMRAQYKKEQTAKIKKEKKGNYWKKVSKKPMRAAKKAWRKLW